MAEQTRAPDAEDPVSQQPDHGQDARDEHERRLHRNPDNDAAQTDDPELPTEHARSRYGLRRRKQLANPFVDPAPTRDPVHHGDVAAYQSEAENHCKDTGHSGSMTPRPSRPATPLERPAPPAPAPRNPLEPSQRIETLPSAGATLGCAAAQRLRADRIGSWVDHIHEKKRSPSRRSPARRTVCHCRPTGWFVHECLRWVV